jgi:predicted RNA binding protein YcfA (HicA-like mRNA interferase family)
MATLPSISFSELKRRIELLGFEPHRQKGSHIRYVHKDGRKTTVPDHGAKDVPKGLLTKIVRHDLGIEMKDFLDSTKA